MPRNPRLDPAELAQCDTPFAPKTKSLRGFLLSDKMSPGALRLSSSSIHGLA